MNGDRKRLYIPRGTLDGNEIEMLAGKIFKCGYAVVKKTVRSGDNKGAKYIEFWTDDQEDAEC